jgi:hypothetical protein
MVTSEDSAISLLVNLSGKSEEGSPPSRPPSCGLAGKVFGVRIGVAKPWSVGVRVAVRGIVV